MQAGPGDRAGDSSVGLCMPRCFSGTLGPRRELGAGEGCDLTYPCGCCGGQGGGPGGNQVVPAGERSRILRLYCEGKADRMCW